MTEEEKTERNQEIWEATAHYKTTDEIRDILLPGFNQEGVWLGLLADCEGTKIDLGGKPTIPKERLLKTHDNGELEYLGAFFGQTTSIELPYHRIKGAIWAIGANHINLPNLKYCGMNLVASDCKTFSAPNLEYIGGYLEFPGEKLELPKLKEVGKRMNLFGVKTIILPKLETIGGSGWLGNATHLYAPKLKTIGGLLETTQAPYFYNPDLTFNESWDMHPDAKQNWENREAKQKKAKEILKTQTEIEI